MTRRTLLDFFADVTSDATAKNAQFLVYDDGYRTWTWTYGDLAAAAHGFARRLRDEHIAAGQAIAIWSENRPEWIAALWGALLEGVVLVPIDYRDVAGFPAESRRASSTPRRSSSATRSMPSALGIGAADLESGGDLPATPEAISGCRPHESRSFRLRRTSTPTTTAEIIFTSGATAEPKGVVLTHKNILANIVPIEREMAKYKKYTRPFRPIRFLNLLPLSHMFGQAMATFVPPMLPGLVVFTRSYSPDDIVRQIRERRISVLVCVPKILEVLRDYIIRVAPEAAEPPPAGHALGEAVVALPPDPPDVRVQVLGDGRRRGAARSGARGVLGPPRVPRRPGLRADRDGARS